MNRFWKVLSYVVVALVAVAITFPFAASVVSDRPNSKLEQVEALITERFIGEADQTHMEDAAAAAMVDSLGDRWSYYIPADEYAAYMEQMNNAYVGIGVTITVMEDNSGFEIMEVTPGSSAEEAGLQVGDVIIAIEGQSTAGMTTTEGRDLVRGDEGTTVKLTLDRAGERIELDVERRKVMVPVATWQLLDGGIGLITIENFDARCAKETIAAIEAVMAEGADKLIFDVRNNPGGYASELVDLLDYLLPEGPLFRTVDYTGRESVDSSDAKCLDVPMVVLVNGDSYSAAEFFAVALKEYDAAVVVGEQTVGKGYFQQTYQMNDGSAVGLSVGEYFTPRGNNLAGVGITPDMIVSVDDETAMAIYYNWLEPMEDPQIQAAVEVLKNS